MRDDSTILSSIPIQAPTASIVGTERPFEISFDLGSPASKQDTEFCCLWQPLKLKNCMIYCLDKLQNSLQG